MDKNKVQRPAVPGKEVLGKQSNKEVMSEVSSAQPGFRVKLTFEQYLIEVHARMYRGLDDEMADDFNDWLVGLDPDEWIRCAEKWRSL